MVKPMMREDVSLTSEKILTTRKKILWAVLDIIGREGFQKVTTRKIAAIADVNIAAVNYHFGSKDNAVNEALKNFIENLTNTVICLEEIKIPAEQRLENFLICYAEVALEYPDVFKNFVYHAINEPSTSFEFIDFMKRIGWEKIKDTIKEITHIENDKILTMKCFQMICCVEFPVLLGNQMKWSFDYQDKKSRCEYLSLLLKSVLYS